MQKKDINNGINNAIIYPSYTNTQPTVGYHSNKADPVWPAGMFSSTLHDKLTLSH